MLQRLAACLVLILGTILPAQAFFHFGQGIGQPQQAQTLQATPGAGNCLQAIPGNCLQATPAGGFVTFFMATTGTDGAGCGTSASPCATPNGVAANNTLVCGDTISAATGTYSQAAMTITSTPICTAQNDVVMVECATPFACHGTTLIQIEASYWGLEGWTMTSGSQACYEIQPPGGGTIGTIAIVDNICSSAFQGGIVYFNGSGHVGNTLTIGNIVYNAIQTTTNCDSGIVHGGMGNFLAVGDELYAAWNFSYGNTPSGPCMGGQNTDSTGLNVDTMSAYTGTFVAENNWLGWNGGAGFEVATGNGLTNAGPILFRYNTAVNNLQWGSLTTASAADVTQLDGGFYTLNGSFDHNLVQGNSPISATNTVAGIYSWIASASTTSLTDDNWLYEAGTNGVGTRYIAGTTSLCLAGHTCNVAGSVGASCAAAASAVVNQGCSGNSFTTSPVLVSATEPGAPSCAGQPDALTCFATQIANLKSTAVGSTVYGAQVAAPTDAYNTTAFLCHVYHEMPATMFASGGGPIPNRC